MGLSCRRFWCCSLVGRPFEADGEIGFAGRRSSWLLRMCRSIAVALVVLARRSAVQRREPGVGVRLRRLRSRQPRSSVADERALIAWDGATEDILMSLSVTGSRTERRGSCRCRRPLASASATPRCSRISARLTAPRIEYRDSWWPTIPWLVWAGAAPDTAGAPAGAVNVLGRQRLGPFDVTRLAADDPTALANWLTDNGFPHPEGWTTTSHRMSPTAGRSSRFNSCPPRTGGSLSGDASAAAPVVRLRHRRLPDAPVAIGHDVRSTSTSTCWRRIEWIPRRFPSRARNRLWSSPGPSSAATPPHWPTSSVTQRF